jgi:hypothetical protein
VSRRVAIIQSSYLPWKGFFDLVARVDELVLFDDVQFTRRDWRNRNRIKTPQGVRWLTVPVRSRGRYHQRIDEVEPSDPGWPEAHWAAIERAYRAAPAFEAAGPPLRALLEAVPRDRLTTANEHLLRGLCTMLGITTTISRSDGTGAGAGRTGRLVALCRDRGATAYLSGPAARVYLDEAAFAAAGIAVEWMSYGPYPEYPQLHGPFEHHVSVVDVLLHTGSDARRHVVLG